MKENIQAMRQQLDHMEAALKQQEADEYENKPHKSFTIGDWVQKGNRIGKVEWTENMACNCPESKGYMAVDLRSGTHGLACFEKRDEWEKIPQDKFVYYTALHTYKVDLTGEQKEQIRYYLCSSNGYNDSAIHSLLEQLGIK